MSQSNKLAFAKLTAHIEANPTVCPVCNENVIDNSDMFLYADTSERVRAHMFCGYSSYLLIPDPS